MAIPIPIVCVIQYQWQYQYQFFFLCNFNINCNSNTFNCLRTNSNVQAINSYWNLPISIAIPIVPDLHKQLSMAMAIPSKTAIPMAPQYYCSCLAGHIVSHCLAKSIKCQRPHINIFQTCWHCAWCSITRRARLAQQAQLSNRDTRISTSNMEYPRATPYQLTLFISVAFSQESAELT